MKAQRKIDSLRQSRRLPRGKIGAGNGLDASSGAAAIHLAPRDSISSERRSGDGEICVRTFSECRNATDPELCFTSNDSRQLIFVYSGAGAVELDGTAFDVRPGTTIAVPSGTLCTLRVEPRAEGVCLKIRDTYFRSQVIAALPALAQTGSPYWQAHYTPIVFNDLVDDSKRARRNEMMRELMATRKRFGLGCDPAVAAYMVVIMFEVQLSAANQPRDPGMESHAQMSARGLVHEFRSLIEQNFTRHLQVHDYCALLKVTPRRLSQLCTQALSAKPLALIHERMFLEAKRELSSSRKTVGAIAAALGFGDVGYFSRFVKQHTGKSPNAFRR
jgi:AraC family transcriptional regulator, transcriptional activator of pobA